MCFNGGEDEVRASSCCTVGGVHEPLLSTGKIVRGGGEIHLTPSGSWMELDGKTVAVRMKGNRFVLDPTRTVSAITAVPDRRVSAGEATAREETEDILDQLATEQRHYDAVQAALNPMAASSSSSSAAPAPVPVGPWEHVE